MGLGPSAPQADAPSAFLQVTLEVIGPGKGQATHVTDMGSQLLVEGVYVRVQVALGQKGWGSMGRPVFVIYDTQVTLELPQLFVDGFDVDLDLGHVLVGVRAVVPATLDFPIGSPTGLDFDVLVVD